VAIVPDQSFDMLDCLARVRLGDQSAATALVTHTHPLVLKIVRAYHARSFNDDDLVQEVYLTMFARLDRYEPRPAVPFEHWLSRLAVNTCRDVLRAERRRPTSAALSSEAQQSLIVLHTGNGTHDHAQAARELVEHLLSQLPPDDCLVLTFLDLEQRSVAEISMLTGWSRPLVKVRAFRARQRLKTVIAQQKTEWP
jgi:RNA polymerase sigma-70 factor (ECF subfamily)